MSESAQQPDQQPQESVTIDVSGTRQTGQNEARVNSRFVSTVNKYRENLLDRPIRYDVLSIIFTILIFIGGLVGYFSSGSVISLVSGTMFTILLAFGIYLEGARRNPYPLIIALFGLTFLMAYRYFKTFNFLPAGLIGLLSLIMLTRHCWLLYLKRASASSSPATGECGQPVKFGATRLDLVHLVIVAQH